MNIDDFIISKPEDLALPWLCNYASFPESHLNFFDSSDQCYVFKNVLLDGSTGIVANLDGSLIEKGLDEIFYWLPSCMGLMPGEVFTDKNKLIKAIETRKQIHSNRAKLIQHKAESEGTFFLSGNNIYLVHPFGFYAYGHLHDSLQRLFNLEAERESMANSRYLISKHDRVSDFVDHFQALAGVSYEYAKQVDNDTIYYCDTLCIPVSPSVPTRFTIESYNWLIKSYIQYFGLLSNIPQANGKGTRLYLSRNHVVPGKRSVLNESDLIQRLTSDYGFTVVTGNESLKDIVSLFSAASFITGPHGSLFANSIFCTRHCSVVEFCPSNRIDKSFEYKIKAVQRYEHIVVDADSDYNITIPLEDIVSRLAV
jgi:hypothetical protein